MRCGRLLRACGRIFKQRIGIVICMYECYFAYGNCSSCEGVLWCHGLPVVHVSVLLSQLAPSVFCLTRRFARSLWLLQPLQSQQGTATEHAAKRILAKLKMAGPKVEPTDMQLKTSLRHAFDASSNATPEQRRALDYVAKQFVLVRSLES